MKTWRTTGKQVIVSSVGSAENEFEFGISVYQAMIDFLNTEVSSVEHRFDVRGLSAIYDHTKAMNFRLHELAPLIGIEKELLIKYNDIEILCGMTVMLYV